MHLEQLRKTKDFKMKNMVLSCLCSAMLFYPLGIVAQHVTGHSGPNPGNNGGGDQGTTTTKKPQDTATAEEYTGVPCEGQVGLVREATQGMDPTEMATMGTITSTAVQAGVEANGSAKTGHESAGVIQTGVAGISGARYIKCKSAISSCVDTCATEIQSQCETMAATPATQGQALACQKQKENIIARCKSHSSSCTAAGAVALSSGLQAALSFLNAKNLDECEGEDCTNDTTTAPLSLASSPPPEGDLPPPSLVPPDPPDFSTNSPPDLLASAEDFSTPFLDVGDEIEDGKIEDDKSAYTKEEAKQDEEIKPNFGLVNDTTNQGTSPSGGLSTTASSGVGESATAGEGEDEGESEEIYYAQLSPSKSLTGGIFRDPGGTYTRSPTNTNRSHFNNLRANPLKMAKLDKKMAVKNQALDKSETEEADDTIFENMSRFIQSHCSKGGKKC